MNDKHSATVTKNNLKKYQLPNTTKTSKFIFCEFIMFCKMSWNKSCCFISNKITLSIPGRPMPTKKCNARAEIT